MSRLRTSKRYRYLMRFSKAELAKIVCMTEALVAQARKERDAERTNVQLERDTMWHELVQRGEKIQEQQGVILKLRKGVVT